MASLAPPRPALSLLDYSQTSMLPAWLLEKDRSAGCCPQYMRRLTYSRVMLWMETTSALGVEHAVPRATLQ